MSRAPVSIWSAVIRSEGEANTRRPAQAGHDHEERVVYVPYQWASGQPAGRSGRCPPGRPADHPAGTARY